MYTTGDLKNSLLGCNNLHILGFIIIYGYLILKQAVLSQRKNYRY